MSEVFISYARSSAAKAEQLAAALRAVGYRVWRDDDLPAHRAYAEVIEERLKAARAVVVVWSQDAARSQWVRAEADLARGAGTLVQLRIDDAAPPLPFNQIECADFSDWTGQDGHRGWRKVLASVSELAGAVEGSPPIATVDTSAAAEPLLAVLAFDNLSDDPEMAYFSDGVSEEILQTVSRGADLRVIGRASSFQFRGPQKAAAHVAAELHVTHVLDGSVRRSGSRVRISIQLIDCASGVALHSDRFDRELTDIFAVQDEIASAVAAALKTAFAASPAPGPIDPALYDLYLRSRNMDYGAELDVRPRITALEQVTALAPALAPAWAALALARAQRLRARRRGALYPKMRGEVVAAAETALRLDPASGDAYIALAHLEPWANYAEREALLGRAMAAAPNDPACRVAMVELCYNLGRHKDAAFYARQACALDPLHAFAVFWRAAMTLYDEGPETFHRQCEAFRARWPAEEALGAAEPWVQALRGDWALFDQAIASMRARGPLAPLTERHYLFYGSLRDPGPDTRARLLERVTGELKASGTVQVWDLFACYSIGLKDETFGLIDRASFSHLFDSDGPPPSGAGQTGGMFDLAIGMPHDVRFVGFCAKLGLCTYWIKTGHWPDCADQVAYDFRAEARRRLDREETQ